MGNSPSTSPVSSPLFGGSPWFAGLEKKAEDIKKDLLSIFDTPESKPIDLGPAAAKMSKDTKESRVARNKAELRSASEKHVRNIARPVPTSKPTAAVRSETAVSQFRRQRSVRTQKTAALQQREVCPAPRSEPPRPRRRVVGDGCPAAEGRRPGWQQPVTETQLRSIAVLVRSLQQSRPDTITSHNVFDCAREPYVSLTGFLAYLVDGVNATPECIALAAVLLCRFAANSGQIVHSRNAHRLLLTAFVLAHKYLNDHYHTNSAYAQLGQIPLRQLNSMEVLMLNGLNWELETTEEELDAVFRA